VLESVLSPLLVRITPCWVRDHPFWPPGDVEPSSAATDEPQRRTGRPCRTQWAGRADQNPPPVRQRGCALLFVSPVPCDCSFKIVLKARAEVSAMPIRLATVPVPPSALGPGTSLWPALAAVDRSSAWDLLAHAPVGPASDRRARIAACWPCSPQVTVLTTGYSLAAWLPGSDHQQHLAYAARSSPCRGRGNLHWRLGMGQPSRGPWPNAGGGLVLDLGRSLSVQGAFLSLALVLSLRPDGHRAAVLLQAETCSLQQDPAAAFASSLARAR